MTAVEAVDALLLRAAILLTTVISCRRFKEAPIFWNSFLKLSFNQPYSNGFEQALKKKIKIKIELLHVSLEFPSQSITYRWHPDHVTASVDDDARLGIVTKDVPSVDDNIENVHRQPTDFLIILFKELNSSLSNSLKIKNQSHQIVKMMAIAMRRVCKTSENPTLIDWN